MVTKITKKTTKKTVAKKAPVKQTTKNIAKKNTKKTTKENVAGKQKVRALVCASGEECFWTTDGSVLENLHELHIAFGSMDDEVFLHHVSLQKNDFADWVEQVLDDAMCAAALRKAKKPASAASVLIKHLRQYDI